MVFEALNRLLGCREDAVAEAAAYLALAKGGSWVDFADFELNRARDSRMASSRSLHSALGTDAT